MFRYQGWWNQGNLEGTGFAHHVMYYVLAPTLELVSTTYTQYPIIRNGLIRNSAEFWEKFKKRALVRSNLKNALKNLRNSQWSDFQS